MIRTEFIFKEDTFHISYQFFSRKQVDSFEVLTNISMKLNQILLIFDGINFDLLVFEEKIQENQNF